MRYLLDTHTFLWSYGQSKKLPAIVRTRLEDLSSEIFVSAVTFWEIAIKLRARRLDVGGKTASELIPESAKLGFKVIPLDAEEAAAHQQLAEDTHFDPFDRMLVWQAISRNLTLISGDSQFKNFKKDGLKLLWK